MTWEIVGESETSGERHPDVPGEPRAYVTRTYAQDEGEWPRFIITVSKFPTKSIVELFFQNNEQAHGMHARFWPLHLLGPIMATCKWAQDRFKVNLMEMSLGLDQQYHLDAPGPFSLQGEAVTEPAGTEAPLNGYVLSRVQAVYDECSLGSYIPSEGGELRLPHDDMWSPIEYREATANPERLNAFERDFRQSLVNSYPLNERGHIWTHITRAVLYVWQESML